MNAIRTPYRAQVLSSKYNHHIYDKAHALAYSVRELDDESYIVVITVMLPEMSLLFQQ